MDMNIGQMGIYVVICLVMGVSPLNFERW